jgi:acetyl-CoA decarbonylase/synthase complex subunit beta
MADSTAGGRQIPGFHGLSIEYLRSPKFIQVDGGWKRVVWMPKAIKDRVGDFIPKDMADKIPTENDVKSLEDLKTYLKDHNHPVVEHWAAVGAAARLEKEDHAAEEAMLPVPGTMVATVPGVGGGFQVIFKNARIYAEKIIVRRQGDKKNK